MEEKVYEYKPVTSSNEILNEIKYILETNKNVDENSNYTPVTLDETCISLANVYTCIINEKNRFETTKKVFKCLIEERIEKHFGEGSLTAFHGLDFSTDEISISFRKNRYDDYKKVVFAKYNDDVYLKSSETSYGKDVFGVLYEIIFNAYNELIKFKNYDQEKCYYVKTINSNFIANISHYGVDICDSPDFSSKFKLIKASCNNTYTCECNSGIVLNTVKGIEDEILKCTFVRIEDCPNWMKDSLYEMRKNELEEQKKQKSIIYKVNVIKKEEEKTDIKSKFLSLFKKTKK